MRTSKLLIATLQYPATEPVQEATSITPGALMNASAAVVGTGKPDNNGAYGAATALASGMVGAGYQQWDVSLMQIRCEAGTRERRLGI